MLTVRKENAGRIASKDSCSADKMKIIMLIKSKLAIKSMLLITIAIVPLVAPITRADQAISEVWSEGDGLRMKYSTNHDDLLSTKGSELSLSTDQNQQQADQGQQQQATGADEVSSTDETSGASQAPESSGDEQSDTNNEQGADSSSRQTEKIPMSGRVQSYSSASNQHAASVKQQQRSKASLDSDSNSDSDSDTDSDDDAIPAAPTRQLSKSKAASPQELSFDSALEQAGDGGETSNVDHGRDEAAYSSSSDGPSSKFRQPGRLFKEAVHMNEPPKASNAIEEDDSSAGQPSQGGGQEPASNDEDPFQDNPQNGRARNNMMDFDRMAAHGLRQRQQAAEEADEFKSRQRHVFGGDDAEEPTAGLRFRAGGASYFDHSGQSRAALATAHKQERLQPTTSSSGLADNRRQQAAAKQNYRQLAYFRGIAEHQATKLGSDQFAANGSPDSVRDNFISPGHFPGSMSHLTQAASEIMQKSGGSPATLDHQKSSGDADQGSKQIDSKAAASEQVSTSAPVLRRTGGAQQDESSQESGISVAPTASDTNNSVQPVPAAEPLKPVEAQANEFVQVVAVTPGPEAQPENQQIMAPILMSTTTMAPMISSSTTTMNTTTTSQAPSLKRFKFRKYR